HGADDRRDRRRRDALGELLQRLVPRLADADLAERQSELVDERPFHVLRQLRHSAVEAETCLDGDREQVERVGKLHPDRLATGADLERKERVGREEAEAERERREQEAERGGRGGEDKQ